MKTVGNLRTASLTSFSIYVLPALPIHTILKLRESVQFTKNRHRGSLYLFACTDYPVIGKVLEKLLKKQVVDDFKDSTVSEIVNVEGWQFNVVIM